MQTALSISYAGYYYTTGFSKTWRLTLCLEEVYDIYIYTGCNVYIVI